jgi:hypothetical protein
MQQNFYVTHSPELHCVQDCITVPVRAVTISTLTITPALATRIETAAVPDVRAGVGEDTHLEALEYVLTELLRR